MPLGPSIKISCFPNMVLELRLFLGGTATRPPDPISSRSQRASLADLLHPDRSYRSRSSSPRSWSGSRLLLPDPPAATSPAGPQVFCSSPGRWLPIRFLASSAGSRRLRSTLLDLAPLRISPLARSAAAASTCLEEKATPRWVPSSAVPLDPISCCLSALSPSAAVPQGAGSVSFPVYYQGVLCPFYFFAHDPVRLACTSRCFCQIEGLVLVCF